jgi:putative transposase
VVKQKKRKRLVRTGLAAQVLNRANQEWVLDSVHDVLGTGQRVRVLSVLDAYTRECLAVEVGQSLKGTDVVALLNQILSKREAPKMLFCDNVLT